MSESNTLTLLSRGVAQTILIGQQLGAHLMPGDVLCLSGALGAGKTALTQGIGQGWGAHEPVTSPTFTLIHEHRRDQDSTVLYHVDCYRLHGTADAWSIGLEELLDGAGIVVLEWPENIAEVLPAERLWIDLRITANTQRQLIARAAGPRYQHLLAALRASGWGS